MLLLPGLHVWSNAWSIKVKGCTVTFGKTKICLMVKLLEINKETQNMTPRNSNNTAGYRFPQQSMDHLLFKSMTT